MSILRALCIVGLFVCVLSHVAEIRIWKDTTGKFSTEAEIVSIDASHVMLKRRDGRTVRVPIERLSPADQKYISGQSQAASGGAVANAQGESNEVLKFADINQLVEKQREALFALRLLESFIASERVPVDQRELAKNEFQKW